MELEKTEHLFSNSASLKLLRSDNAPLIISFLLRAFKDRDRLVLPSSTFIEMLESDLNAYGDRVRNQYPGDGAYYLNQWCDDNHRFLRRYYDTGDEPVVEPTVQTERVLSWFQDLDSDEFIGTES